MTNLANSISIEKFFKILFFQTIELDDLEIEDIKRSRAIIKALGESNTPIYGVTTGFGEMINRLIPHQYSAQLQKNLIRTHATGMGDIIHPFLVRAIMLARLITFCKGNSGIALETVERIVKFLNIGNYPLVHTQGSLGASGDLSPMAEIALALIGESATATEHGIGDLATSFVASLIQDISYVTSSSKYTLAIPSHYNYSPYTEKLDLNYKEGLSLINGTPAMTAYALMTCKLAKTVYDLGILATAFSLAALRVSTMHFDHEGIVLKGHPDMIEVAKDIRFWLKDCKLTRNQEDIIDRLKIPLERGKEQNLVIKTEEFLQNAYSLRCIPQVLGGYLLYLRIAKNITENELNGVDDNPLTVFPKDKDAYIYHGAHFHGQYIGYAMDSLKIPLIQLAQLSDRRTARLIDANYNDGLTDLLAPKQEGLSCGFEGLQYTSTSIVAEMKSLASPASIQSIPSNLNNQDLVSMGMISARQAFDLAQNSLTVVCVELRTALQALTMRMKIQFSKELAEVSQNPQILLGSALARAYKFFVLSHGMSYVKKDRYLGSELISIKKIALKMTFANLKTPLTELFEKKYDFRD